jgi:predicted DNA-binding protein
LSEIISIRLDPKLLETLETLSKLTKLNKSEIIRLALDDLIEKAYSMEEHPRIKQYLAYQKAKNVERQLKQIRYMLHLKRSAEYWGEYIEKLDRGEIKGNPTSKRHNILINQNPITIETIKNLENELVEAIKQYEKTLEVEK